MPNPGAGLINFQVKVTNSNGYAKIASKIAEYSLVNQGMGGYGIRGMPDFGYVSPYSLFFYLA